MKKLWIMALLGAFVFGVGAAPVSAAQAVKTPKQGMKDGLKNGLKNGHKQGLKQGPKNGLKDG